MAFFTKGGPADQNLRAAKRELSDWNDRHNCPIDEDSQLEAENLSLQAKVRDAEKGASRGERFR